MALDYFRALFSTTGVGEGIYGHQGLFPPITTRQLAALSRPVDDEEIKGVIFAMSPLKAPVGPLAIHVIGNQWPVNLTTVVADMVDVQGQWWWNLFEHLLSCEILLHIAAVKPPLGISYYCHGWLGGVRREFSIRSAYVARKGRLIGPVEPI
ncbi:hypothetical protein V6N11_075157 [Hibiscus sabdariffa]|uniref:Uncharacterized protein n=1 Tax=Hibiscus sabdariffa TaxID=183260 RepID=A0ABR2R5Z4_9ROSI